MKGKRWFIVAGIAGAVLSLGLLAAACDEEGDGAATPTAGETPAETPAETPEEGAINIELTEFAIEATPSSGTAGSVTFNIRNAGAEAHEFMVIRTELPAASLPTLDDGSVDETGVEVVDEIEEDELPAGGSATLTVDLDPGTYALICNLVEQEDTVTESHYAEAMYLDFEVQ